MLKSFNSLSIFFREIKKYNFNDEAIILIALRITNNPFSKLNDYLRNNFLFKALKINKPINSNLILEKAFENITSKFNKKNLIKIISKKNIKKFSQIKKMITLAPKNFLDKNHFNNLKEKKFLKMKIFY